MIREPLPGWEFAPTWEHREMHDDWGEASRLERWAFRGPYADGFMEVTVNGPLLMAARQLQGSDSVRRSVVAGLATALGLAVVAPEDAERLAAYDRELSAVMPHDFKDWWENSRAEWPLVARKVIEDRRLTDGGWPDAQEGGAP